MIVSESNVVVATVITLRVDSEPDRSLSAMDRCRAFRSRFERRIRHIKGGGQCRPRRVTGGAARLGVSFIVPSLCQWDESAQADAT
jgi:hypothetical protein